MSARRLTNIMFLTKGDSVVLLEKHPTNSEAEGGLGDQRAFNVGELDELVQQSKLSLRANATRPSTATSWPSNENYTMINLDSWKINLTVRAKEVEKGRKTGREITICLCFNILSAIGSNSNQTSDCPMFQQIIDAIGFPLTHSFGSNIYHSIHQPSFSSLDPLVLNTPW